MPTALGLGRRRRRLGHLQPGLRGELLHRFHEAGALALHDETDRIAVRAAAEAMVVIVVNVEARCLLAVERTAALPLSAGARQAHAPADHPRQRGARAQLVKKNGGKRHQADSFTFAAPAVIVLDCSVNCSMNAIGELSAQISLYDTATSRCGPNLQRKLLRLRSGSFGSRW